LYLDEEENGYGGHGRVLDEGPLTDVDNVDIYEEVYGDGEGDAEEMSDGDYYHQQYQYGAHDTSTASAPLPASSTPTPTQTPSRQHGTRIPSPRAVTPTPAPPMQRGQSEPPSLPASGSLSQAGRRLQQTPNAKRGATSPPPASSSSASKRPRAAATPKAKPKPKPKVTPKRDDKDRRSVAYYPSPGEDDGEDLADAIPTWTQPVKPQTGRWDDVSGVFGLWRIDTD
jgi:serine/arginine repetitive matrix protein 1